MFKVTVLDDNGNKLEELSKEFTNEKEARDYWLNGTLDYQAKIEEV